MNSNEMFIGREPELERLRRDVFFVEDGSFGYCYSLIGLNGIGKTALIRRLGEEFNRTMPPKTFYYATMLAEGITFWDYWADLILKLADDIDGDYLAEEFPTPSMSEKNAIKKILKMYQFVQTEGVGQFSPAYKAQLAVQLNDLFKYYTILGIRIILTIDEFDLAQTVFQDGQFFQRLFGLTPKGSPTRLNLSVITVSRRRVSTIAHHMQEGSNFEDAYPPLALKGFSNEELETYFETYRQLPCGIPDADAKKQILYLCGRSPGLLMGFRHEVAVAGAGTCNVGEIYAEHSQFIGVAYNRMISLMETSFVDRECERPLTDIFIQQFIGPVCDENFDVELPSLYDHGFVTKAVGGADIFALSGVERQRGKGATVTYEPIAPYFLEYLKYRVLPNKLSNLSGMLIRAEKLTREIIQKEMSAAFPDTWEAILNTYAEKKDFYLQTLQIRALQNDFSSSSISKLNVISFKEYFYIIKTYWNLFSKYFTAYESKDALYQTMAFLNDCRNDSAHLNLSVYNSENRRRIRELCGAYIDSIERLTAPERETPIPDAATIAEWTETQRTVIFRCEAIKMPKGNLRGSIKDFGYSAGIAKRSLDEFSFAAPPQVGDEIETRVDRWDEGAKMFNLKAPS